MTGEKFSGLSSCPADMHSHVYSVQGSVCIVNELQNVYSGLCAPKIGSSVELSYWMQLVIHGRLANFFYWRNHFAAMDEHPRAL